MDRLSTKRPLITELDAHDEGVAPAKIQKTEVPDTDWSIGKYIKLIVNKNSRASQNSVVEMTEWLNFLKDLFLEWTRRKYNYETLLERDNVKDQRYVTMNKKYYENQFALIKTLSCKLFEAKKEKFPDIMSLLMKFEGQAFIDNIHGEFGCASARLQLKYCINSSASMEKRVVSAFKNILQKGTLKFATDSNVVSLKYNLWAPSIKELKNPTGRGWGRYCSLLEVHRYLHLDRTIVKNLTFFFGNNPVPKIISINHSDGSTQTQTIPLFGSHQRYLNFGAVGRNPAGLLPMVLEQDKESRHLIDIAHTSSLEAAISEYTTNGTFVRCLGLLSCQFCKKNMQPEVKRFPGHGEVMGHPAIETKFVYVWDLSAHKKGVSCKKSYCLFCNLDLSTHSYMEYLSPDGSQLQSLPHSELTTIDNYATADNIFRNHMEKFRESMPSYERPDSIHGIELKLFEDSQFFADYLAELKEQFPNSHLKFKGWTSDKITCMRDRVLDSLHAYMKYGEIVMELFKVAAERVELLHPGLGLHCLAMSLRFAGLTKVANNIKEEGVRQYSTKLKTFVSVQDRAVTTMSSEEAMAREFVAYVENDAKKARVEELCRQLKVGPIQNKKISVLKTHLAKKSPR